MVRRATTLLVSLFLATTVANNRLHSSVPASHLRLVMFQVNSQISRNKFALTPLPPPSHYPRAPPFDDKAKLLARTRSRLRW